MKYAKMMLLASSLLSGLVLSSLTLAADPKGDAKLSNMPKLGLVSGKAGGSYTLSIPAAPGSFNYYGITDNNAYTVVGNVFEGLVEYNLETYKMEPTTV